MFYDKQKDSSNEVGAPWMIMHDPNFQADPAVDGTKSSTFIIINFSRRMVLIGGTHYAGEIKKSIFTVLNFLLPDKNVLPMHSSVTVESTQVNSGSIFFGLSGTGKTTLSAEPQRTLVGDDEHGWCPDGSIFNFEDGCYAKAIKLSKKGEPLIWDAVHQFGTVLENVKVVNSECDFNSNERTENTRAAYKLSNVKTASKTRTAAKANTIFMLACDAYGILPPLSKLTPEQAAYYFLSGYTAKVAGTEAGVKEPTATFSTCFGAPFLPRHPVVYANMLIQKIKEHSCSVYLVNTGWTGGPYGIGSRIDLSSTRKLINFAIYGNWNYQPNEKSIDQFHFEIDPIFNINFLSFNQNLPYKIPLLNPEQSWINNGLNNYADKAKELADKFKQNFKKYEGLVSLDILNAGPK
jgi:phosphoenolpyruvate carboxykinase (ATP)